MAENGDEPDSLQNLCIFYCANNLDVITTAIQKLVDTTVTSKPAGAAGLIGGRNKNKNFFARKKKDPIEPNVLSVSGVELIPSDVWNRLFAYTFTTCLGTTEKTDARLLDLLKRKDSLKLSYFRTIKKTKLGFLMDFVRELSGHDLTVLDLNISARSDPFGHLPKLIKSVKQSLQVLKVKASEVVDDGGHCSDFIVQELLYSGITHPAKGITAADVSKGSFSIITLPNLHTFSLLASAKSVYEDKILTKFLTNTSTLTVLILVVTTIKVETTATFDLGVVQHLPNLMSLVLSDVNTSFTIDRLLQLTLLKNLRHLDISCRDVGGHYNGNVEEGMLTLIQCLPRLVSLDISGTNLDAFIKGFPTREEQEATGEGVDMSTRDNQIFIPGLEGRYFEFLGLWNCENSSYQFLKLPARKVSGFCDENQLLAALAAFQHSPALMGEVIMSLAIFYTHVSKTISQPSKLVEGLLVYIQQYPDYDLTVQVEATRFLRVVLLREKQQGQRQSIVMRRRILEATVVLMDFFLPDTKDVMTEEVEEIMEYVLAVFDCLEIPADALYCYQFDHIVRIMMFLIRQSSTFVTQALEMIRSLCRFRPDVKRRLESQFQIIEFVMTEIRSNLQLACPRSDVMVRMWGLLVSLTDEMQDHCTRLIQNAGVDLAVQCLKRFGDKDTDLRESMALVLGNCAEVKSLRPSLMTEEMFTFCRTGLDPEKNNMELSFFCTTILVHILSDGPEVWPPEGPDRGEIVWAAMSAMEKWETSEALVVFSSLGPVLEHLQPESEHVAQHWSALILKILTTVRPYKYYPLLWKEHGKEVLETLISNDRTKPDIKDMLQEILSKHDNI